MIDVSDAYSCFGTPGGSETMMKEASFIVDEPLRDVGSSVSESLVERYPGA